MGSTSAAEWADPEDVGRMLSATAVMAFAQTEATAA
jgi:hypothetical protein